MNLGTKLTEGYKKLKLEHPDTILLYQVGNFFKIMFEDARKTAEPLGLKLFVMGAASAPVAVCGFPTSGLDKYVGRLVRAGFPVAVARQVKSGDGSIRREVSEVIICSKTS